jgi:tRNA(adenine34) deaminase
MDKIKQDNQLMRYALNEAEKALKRGEVPIGAIVVDEAGNIIGRGYNRMEMKKCQTEHAEIVAIKKACKKKGDWRLNKCWLYVTVEPCSMCMGLIKLCRIEGVVWGANAQKLPLRQQNMVIKEGIQKEECTTIVKNFFHLLRKKKEMQ